MRTTYSAAQQAIQTQPAGGPFVAMAYIQGIGKGPLPKTPGWWVDTMTGYPRLRLPYGAPYKEQRGYTEGLAPVDASVDPRGAEIGIVGDRWHRFWHYFERAPDQDWTSAYATTLGQPRKAYRYSMWFADTQRGPIRVVNEAIISIPATDTKGIVQMAAHMGAGNSNVGSMYAGRGALIAYTRNWVVLHGTSKDDARALLVPPVK